MATRLMQVLFSAVEKGDEKLTDMVGEDIRAAVKEGKAEDNLNDLSYEHKGDGVVAITDKKTGEVTMAERDPEGTEDEFNLWTPDDELEGYVHPERDGVTPGNQEGVPMDDASDHIAGGDISDQTTVLPHDEEAIREFSEANSAFQKIFSNSVLVESLFSEVVDADETATVGDLVFQKVPGEEALIVTDKSTGNQVKVSMDDENLNVVELESRNFGSDCYDGQCEAGDSYPEDTVGFWVVGLDAENHQLVESQEATEEAANAAADRFEEVGFTGVEIFDDMGEAADYARGLLEHLGADEIEEETEEREFSDGMPYLARTFSTSHSNLMYRMFSEAVEDADACCEDEETIKDALRDGEEVKVEDDVIIPLRDDLGLIHDTENDEYTKVEVEDDGGLSYTKVDEDEAEELKQTAHSQIYSNEEGTKFFSAAEPMTNYMIRLFSEEADEDAIIEAIESGEEAEHDNEIITPIDDQTAIIEDKENGEFTKATIDDEDDSKVEVEPIDEDEAEELKQTTHSQIYSNEEGTKFFSENEPMTNYMLRLFSEEADEEAIVDAIESEEQVEHENEIITPVDDETAVIEDKETGEFTKATLGENDSVNVEAISEEEANDLTEDVDFEDSDEDGEEKETHHSEIIYTNDEDGTKFFSENEPMTNYMIRLFSEEADEEDIVDAIENGKTAEHENEIITPIDENTAVIEDKENGEFTKATLDEEDDSNVNVEAISEEEAHDLIENAEPCETCHSIYSDEDGTRYFAKNEVMTDYMLRLFSEEADEEDIVEAIENGKKVEDEDQIITPVDDQTAIIEDPETGEFTKATLAGEDNENVNIEAISEEEAHEAIEGAKNFSTLTRFFADVTPAQGQLPVGQPAQEATTQEVTLQPGQSVVVVDENGNPVAQPGDENAPTSVEEIEDKALAAVQSIQEAAQAATEAIQEAKMAPAENAEAPLQEAQFSQKTYSETNANDVLLSWFKGNKIG